MTLTPRQPQPPTAGGAAAVPAPAAGEPPAAGRTSAGLALELLVHGVGGATPAEMLGDSGTVRTQGDAIAATYRLREDADAERHPERYHGRAVPEAYCWSALTSGDGTRALWLLLLPFMVVNLAHWMRPPGRDWGSDGRPRIADACYDLLVRLLALSLTVLFAATACEVAMDLVAWQCAGSRPCAAAASWLSFTAAPGWWSLPGRRLALAAVVPLALVGLLWWLSHRTWRVYETQRPATAPAAGTAPLEQPGFWYGKRLVGRLRVAHVTAALLTVAAALLAPPLRQDLAGGPGHWGMRAAAGLLLAAGTAGQAAGALTILVGSRRSERHPDERPDGRLVRVLHWRCLGTVAAVAVYAAWSRAPRPATGRLPGASALFTGVTAAQLVLVGLLVVAALALRSGGAPPGPREAGPREAGPRPPLHDEGFGGPGTAALGGLAGPATAALACGLGSVLTAGVIVWTADRLGAGHGPGGAVIPGPPVLPAWHAAGFPVLLLVLAVLAAAGVARTLRRRNALKAGVLRAYGQTADTAPQRTAEIAGALARARLTDAAPVVVGAAALFWPLVSAAAVAGSLLTGATPADVARGAGGPAAWAAGTAQALGSWLVGTAVVMLVALGRWAYRTTTARRTVGILWDVGTFWPRAAHPFAPPCYAERAVPDLVWRIRGWCEGRPDRRLVLSAHSQGTVLGAAALWQLDPALRARVGLLTYGSPLLRLYARFFPAHMGPPCLARLHAGIPDWRNLYRWTDPIGGPVCVTGPDGAGAVDAPPLADPLTYGRSLRYPLPTPVRTHFRYREDPAFTTELAAVLRRV